MERVALLTRHWVATKAVSDGCQGTVSPKPHEWCSRGCQGQQGTVEEIARIFKARGRLLGGLRSAAPPANRLKQQNEQAAVGAPAISPEKNEGSRKAPSRRLWHEPWHPGTGNRRWFHMTSRALRELSAQKPGSLQLPSGKREHAL